MPLSLTLLIIAMGVGVFPWPGPSLIFVDASESPERECCDPIYPLLTPTASTVINPTSLLPTVPGPPGPNVKHAVSVMNCILAKQLCQEDPSCSTVYNLIPTLCGIEQVACSTVNVVKCQAALRMLQSYQFFRPTCLCREKIKDPECNQFRDLLFDHPCIYVLQKEKDPYPVESLPTCNHALTVCQLEHDCIKLFDDFKLHCKVRDGVCKMDDRELCLESWSNLRNSPMFGCICPNNPMKRRCDRIFNIINNNPCIGRKRRAAVQSAPGDDKDYLEKVEKSRGSSDGALRIYHLSSTCHFALTACQKEKECRSLVQPILRHCDMSRCNRMGCMQGLQNFYRNSTLHWALEVAFCLCRRTENLNDDCLVAQEKLHPICPQRVEGAMPTCHSIANTCREDRTCRIMLEQFEQSCAVDSVTKKCAGSTDRCRKAMLGILGTELRTTCACKGTDYIQLYECLGWQRLLWLNPCVVEAQKDYHSKRPIILPPELYRASQIISPVVPWNTSKTTLYGRKNETEVFTNGKSVTASRAGPSESNDNNALAEVNIIEVVSYSVSPPEKKTHTAGTLATTGRAPAATTAAAAATSTFATSSTSTTTTTSSTTTKTTTTTTTTTSTTTTTTTTTTPATTTLPPKYCLVERERQAPQYIVEGAAKRLYKEDEPECSEVCHCQIGEHLECRTICVKRAACKSEFAFYNHAAPAYQAYRGRCMCYSGRFICMRPHPDHYSIPQGIFLFLGYSEADEILLKPHNNLSVIDIASTLQQILSQMHNKTSCTLELFNITRENLIMIAHPIRRINATLKSSELIALAKECAEELQDLSDKINSKDPEVHSHLLLSIVKLAEVEVKVPEVVSDISTPLIPDYLLMTWSTTSANHRTAFYQAISNTPLAAIARSVHVPTCPR